MGPLIGPPSGPDILTTVGAVSPNLDSYLQNLVVGLTGLVAGLMGLAIVVAG